MTKGKSHSGSPADALFQSVYKALRVLMHLTAAVQFSYGVYYDYMYVKFPVSSAVLHNPFGGKFKYLTFINAIVQAVYYIICLINDFVGTNEVLPKRTPKIRKIKDYFMASFAFPIALNVGITFWTLYGIDRELVFPKVLDPVFPSWLNHVVHTNVVVFIVLEMFTSFRSYPQRMLGIMGLMFFMISYLIWIHIIWSATGLWVYPVLEVLQGPQRAVFFIAVLSFTICLYLLGEFLNKKIWDKELKVARQAYRKVK